MKICCVKNELLPSLWLKETCALPTDGISFDRFTPSWIERSVAEKDASYKQLIPYVIVQNAQNEFLCYPRHGSEARLHGFYSCGIGGHIDEADKRNMLSETIRTGMMREILEELDGFEGTETEEKIEKALDITQKGIVYDADSEVGSVHLAIVFLARCIGGFVPKPTEETKGAEWKTLPELQSLGKETWSDLALRLF